MFTPTLITDWCAPKRIAANVDPMTGQRYFGYGLRGFGVASDRTHSCRRPSSSSRSRRDAPQSDAEDRDHGRERDGPQERVVDLLAVDDLPGRRLLRHLACGERGECRARSARRKLVARTRRKYGSTPYFSYAFLVTCKKFRLIAPYKSTSDARAPRNLLVFPLTEERRTIAHVLALFRERGTRSSRLQPAPCRLTTTRSPMRTSRRTGRCVSPPRRHTPRRRNPTRER